MHVHLHNLIFLLYLSCMCREILILYRVLWNWLTLINRFHAIGLFLHPLKTSENQRFSDVFRGYRKRPVEWSRVKGDFESQRYSFDLSREEKNEHSNRYGIPEASFTCKNIFTNKT